MKTNSVKLTICKYIIITVVFVTGCKPEVKDNYSILSRYKANYKAAAVTPSFIPLPAGAVKPEGWIKDWAETAAQGITGHLDEYSPTYQNAWKGVAFKGKGIGPDGTGWPLEQGSYWLDGAIRLAYILNDTFLINKISKRLDIVVDGVLKGGESFIYWKPKKILTTEKSGGYWARFENWGHSHMGRALVAYYQATHNERILQALVKVYREYPIGELWYDFYSVTGACNVDAISETFSLSGDKVILDSLLSYSKSAKYKSVSERWSKGDLAPGHDVIYYEDIRVPALLYQWTGNKTDLNATLKAIEWGEKDNLLPVGLCSGEEYHAGIGATRNIETCDVAASMWTFLWMLRITGETDYSDRIEKIFFNAGSPPVSRDFKIMCYYQSMNRYSNKLPGEEPKRPGPDGSYKFTPIAHPVLCCVGNVNRIIPNYIMNMWMATMDNGIAATLYGPCKVNTIVNGNQGVEIDCKTSYPFEEKITMTINLGKKAVFPIYLHIPSWCKDPEVLINETPVDIQQDGNKFVRISRVWKNGDEIVLNFPMKAKVITGRETPYPQIKYFDKYHKMAKDTTINNPFAYIYYGPLLFSLPIPDLDPNNEMPGVKFNYALDINPDSIEDQITITRKAMPEKWNWSLDAPVQLSVKATEFDWNPTENQPLPKTPVEEGPSARINLVPYGTTKFRVTMFPVTEKSWSLLDK